MRIPVQQLGFSGTYPSFSLAHVAGVFFSKFDPMSCEVFRRKQHAEKESTLR